MSFRYKWAILLHESDGYICPCPISRDRQVSECRKVRERYKSRLGQDKDSKTPGDGVTPAILQRSEAKTERVVTWVFAGRWQVRDL